MTDLMQRTVVLNEIPNAQTAFVIPGRRLCGWGPVETTSLSKSVKLGEHVVWLFNPSRNLTSSELLDEYAKRGYTPTHPYILAELNRKDAIFSNDVPNATVWSNENYAIFDCWSDGPRTTVCIHSHPWDQWWWFAGTAL